MALNDTTQKLAQKLTDPHIGSVMGAKQTIIEFAAGEVRWNLNLLLSRYKRLVCRNLQVKEAFKAHS